jgi:DNA-binding PadR family transcriptional regulator
MQSLTPLQYRLLVSIFRNPRTYGYQLLTYGGDGLAPSSTYQTLRQLYGMGCVSLTARKQKNAPAKRCYTCTNKGRRYLQTVTQQEVQLAALRKSYLKLLIDM